MTPCPENAASEVVFIVMRNCETPVRQIKTKKGKMKMGTNKTIDLDKAIDMPANGIDVIPTGIPSLDEMLGGGLRRGSLTVIASRPGMGKTSFALQLAGNFTAAGKHVIVFSSQLTKESILQRFKKSSSSVPAWDTLCIDDVICLSIGSILEKVSSREQCDVILIDDLQLLADRSTINDCIRTIKALARLLNIPVIVTSYLPRTRIEKRYDHRPILSDLDFVIPEMYADVVIFPFRESYYSEEESEKSEKAELIVAKNRYGATGVIPVYWDHEKMIIEEKSE